MEFAITASTFNGLAGPVSGNSGNGSAPQRIMPTGTLFDSVGVVLDLSMAAHDIMGAGEDWGMESWQTGGASSVAEPVLPGASSFQGCVLDVCA